MAEIKKGNETACSFYQQKGANLASFCHGFKGFVISGVVECVKSNRNLVAVAIFAYSYKLSGDLVLQPTVLSSKKLSFSFIEGVGQPPVRVKIGIKKERLLALCLL